ncbi:hypothetical protein FB451DRAFT_1179267 [Mycena latifolia]|nr:hypothetical protein FB451DRAFT_1179267 [Mycena latifolia]
MDDILSAILLFFLGLTLLAGNIAAICLISACFSVFRPKSYTSRGSSRYSPRARFDRGDYVTGAGRGGGWRLNLMDAVQAPGNFHASLLLRAPPTAFQQIGRYRRAGDAEAGILLQELFIGIGPANVPAIAFPGPLAEDPSSRISSSLRIQHVWGRGRARREHRNQALVPSSVKGHVESVHSDVPSIPCFTAIGSTEGADEKFPVWDVFKEFLKSRLFELTHAELVIERNLSKYFIVDNLGFQAVWVLDAL